MSIRRELTPNELTFVYIALERINPTFLSKRQRELLKSIHSQFAYDSKLSDSQLAILKNFKAASDKRKRSDAIASGRLTFDDAARTDAKLNTVFNEVGKKH